MVSGVYFVPLNRAHLPVSLCVLPTFVEAEHLKRHRLSRSVQTVLVQGRTHCTGQPSVKALGSAKHFPGDKPSLGPCVCFNSTSPVVSPLLLLRGLDRVLHSSNNNLTPSHPWICRAPAAPRLIPKLSSSALSQERRNPAPLAARRQVRWLQAIPFLSSHPKGGANRLASLKPCWAGQARTPRSFHCSEYRVCLVRYSLGGCCCLTGLWSSHGAAWVHVLLCVWSFWRGRGLVAS